MAAGSYSVSLCCCGPHMDDNDFRLVVIEIFRSYYSPKRAGVRLGVMGACSLLPGVQIFNALKWRKNKFRSKISFICCDNSDSFYTATLNQTPTLFKLKTATVFF